MGFKLQSIGRMLMAGAILASTLLTALPAGAAGTSLYVDPSAQSVVKDQVFTVSLKVNTSTAIRGVQARLTWDPAVVQFQSWNDGGADNIFRKNGFDTEITNMPAPTQSGSGQTAIASQFLMGGVGGATGTGTVWTFTFKALSAGAAMSAIGLSNTLVSDVNAGAVVHSTQGGEVYVNQPVPYPDLQVTSLFVEPLGGNNYNVKFTIANTGTSAAGASVAEIDIDGVKSTVNIDPLAAGASQNVTFGPVTVAGGSDSITVTADATNLIVESNEGNNTRTINYSPAGAVGDVIVNATFGAFCALTDPADVLDWTLALGANTTSSATPMNVKCNIPWTVQGNDANNAGKMRQFNGTTWGPALLTDALGVDVVKQTLGSGYSRVISGSPQLLAEGPVTPHAGLNFDFGWAQNLYYNDPTLPAGQYYHLVLTLNLAPDFS